jgi:hypothetical protein
VIVPTILEITASAIIFPGSRIKRVFFIKKRANQWKEGRGWVEDRKERWTWKNMIALRKRGLEER